MKVVLCLALQGLEVVKDRVCALCGSGSCKLSKEYCRFSVDSLKWHSVSSRERKKHVLAFRSYKPSLEDQFKKPRQSGRKPSDRTRKRKPEPEILIDRLEDREKKPEKKVRIDDSHAKRTVSYELFFRYLVP